MGKWISVKERHPVKADYQTRAGGETVIILYDAKSDEVYTDWFFDEAPDDEKFGGNKNVTHWQPLPAPPTD